MGKGSGRVKYFKGVPGGVAKSETRALTSLRAMTVLNTKTGEPEQAYNFSIKVGHGGRFPYLGTVSGQLRDSDIAKYGTDVEYRVFKKDLDGMTGEDVNFTDPLYVFKGDEYLGKAYPFIPDQDVYVSKQLEKTFGKSRK